MPCGIFSVNEPVIFGLPVILNPIMLIPFIICPIVLVCLGYALINLNCNSITNFRFRITHHLFLNHAGLSWGIYQLVAVVISLLFIIHSLKQLTIKLAKEKVNKVNNFMGCFYK
ncbi:MAG: hypothetical protein ACLR43_00080 [Faecalibacillus faecis]